MNRSKIKFFCGIPSVWSSSGALKKFLFARGAEGSLLKFFRAAILTEIIWELYDE